jgi:uncharacterized membrane protein
MPIPPVISRPFAGTLVRPPSFPLAQGSGAGGGILWSVVVILLCVAAFWLISVVRKRLKEDAEVTAGPATGFTLSDLRQLHKSGQMTDAEFERAKEKIVEAGRRAAAQMPSPLASRRNPPPG